MKSLFGVVFLVLVLVTGQVSAVLWPAGNVSWDVEYEGDVLPTEDATAWVETGGSYESGVVGLFTEGADDYFQIDTLDTWNAQRNYSYPGLVCDFDSGVLIEMRTRIYGGTLHTGGFTVGDSTVGYVSLSFLLDAGSTDGHIKMTTASGVSYKVITDMDQWHVYRVAITGSDYSVYIDDATNPIFTGQVSAAGSDGFKFGDE